MQNCTVTLRGINRVLTGEVDIDKGVVDLDGIDYDVDTLPLDIPEIKTVYGALLNYQGAYEALQPKMQEEPYKAPPEAPVLYIKPKNTWISHGQAIPLPEGENHVEIGAALGVVIGKTATKVTAETALEYVAGYTIVNDVSIPHDNFHRPAVTKKARDGFCPVGPWVMHKDAVANPNDLAIQVAINGEVKQENTTKNLVRSVETLLKDVTAFMTLSPGDVLLVGVPENAPLAKENDHVSVKITGIGELESRVVKESDVLLGGTSR
jgi:5-oxopent-3-ene-1,2,5-tricarboxylate decarboxylase/2-hydroxyhepta-2,4-diene-1,7-dioate isomerase